MIFPKVPNPSLLDLDIIKTSSLKLTKYGIKISGQYTIFNNMIYNGDIPYTRYVDDEMCINDDTFKMDRNEYEFYINVFKLFKKNIMYCIYWSSSYRLDDLFKVCMDTDANMMNVNMIYRNDLYSIRLPILKCVKNTNFDLYVDSHIKLLDIKDNMPFIDIYNMFCDYFNIVFPLI